MKYLMLFEEWLNEGIRKEGESYVFNYTMDSPSDIMSLKLHPFHGREMKMEETIYSYYNAYEIDKSEYSTDLMKAIKSLDASIKEDDLRILVNKAVAGFDNTFGITNFDTIVAPESSSKVLTSLTKQIQAKGNLQLFSHAFVKAANTNITFDQEKVEALPEKTKKQFYAAFKKVQEPGKPFKIKEVFNRFRKFLHDFIIFNKEEDRHLFNAVQGKKVILVDDYKTTGTTVKEMLKQLADAGADEVVVFILIKLGE